MLRAEGINIKRGAVSEDGIRYEEQESRLG